MGHLASERIPNFDPSSPKPVWGGKEERKRETNGKRERDLFKERSSYFSIGFPMIEPAIASGARGRVDPHS